MLAYILNLLLAIPLYSFLTLVKLNCLVFPPYILAISYLWASEHSSSSPYKACFHSWHSILATQWSWELASGDKPLPGDFTDLELSAFTVTTQGLASSPAVSETGFDSPVRMLLYPLNKSQGVKSKCQFNIWI